jgi:hypothetical protein
MHEAALAAAALPAPTRILGMTMRPYSLGHELFLIRENNPLLSGGKANVTRADLAQAVLICASSFQECRQIPFRITPTIGIILWRRRTRKMPLGPNVEAFRNYREDGTREFPAGRQVNSDSGGKVAGAPFLLRLYQFLIIELAIPYNEAWDYPLGMAQMQFATYWEEKGCFSIYSQMDDIQNMALAELDKQEAKCQG